MIKIFTEDFLRNLEKRDASSNLLDLLMEKCHYSFQDAIETMSKIYDVKPEYVEDKKSNPRKKEYMHTFEVYNEDVKNEVNADYFKIEEDILYFYDSESEPLIVFRNWDIIFCLAEKEEYEGCCKD